MFFAKVISQSVMNVSGNEVSDDYIQSASDISGLCANVCYSNGYTPESIDSKMKDTKANTDRFVRVASTGHHSVADHTYFSVYLSGISKMMAMILNSLEFYTTSERSARYTNIDRTASEDEARIYSKWKDIILERIKKEYPDFDSKRQEKLAMENARYFISVTGPYTSMVYTTSFRQWSYIAQWFDDFSSENSGLNTFLSSISNEMNLVRDFILESGIGCPLILKDTKHRKLRFLLNQTNSISSTDEQFGEMYRVRYQCSMACLAQAQRHRTLRYLMDFDETADNFEFYVPHIISDLEDEWISDMKYLVSKGMYPQGILVNVIESGDINDLILKCEERLCGRAQLEVAESTLDTVCNIMNHTESREVYDLLLDLFIPGERVKAKCELIGGCQEHCEFGARYALNRGI